MHEPIQVYKPSTYQHSGQKVNHDAAVNSLSFTNSPINSELL